jgi:hypothetical protein
MNTKKFLSLFLYIFLCLFFYLTPSSSPLSSVSGQENLDKTVNYICLKKIHCDENSSCTSKSVHRVQLSTDPQKKFPSNKEVYIAECIYYTENNQTIGTCTTGSDILDQQIFKSNNFSILNSKTGYTLSRNETYGIYKIKNNQAIKIDPQIFNTNAAGETPVLEWQSYTPQRHERKWYGFFIAQTQEEQQMGQGGLQQGKVEFPPFQDKDCAAISWDPAGRAFDAKTLEPIPNVQVMLLKNYNGQFADARKSELTIVNPYITLEDGGFSFYVSNGKYKLTPSHPNYSFPVNSLNEISKNYDQIYLNPRYGKPKEPKTLIYPAQNGEIINVLDRMEFRDIPLKPNNNVGYTYPLKVYSFTQQINKLTQKIVFSGKASHPFTKVTLYKKSIDENSQETSKVFGSYLSNHLGQFNFSIPLSSLKENESINDAKFEKSDLTNLNFNQQSLMEKIKSLLTKIFKKVSAQQSNVVTLKINPIFPRLEGFAYDENRKVLPNTKVGIYLSFSNVPYYTTTTDEKGYFQILSNKLPNEPYEIRYQTENKETIKVSTSKFLSQNASYLTKNKINLNQVVDEKGKVITPTKISPTKTTTGFNSYFPSHQLPTSNSKTPNSSSTGKTNVILLTILILLILITTVFALLFFYYQKNRSQSQL